MPKSSKQQISRTWRFQHGITLTVSYGHPAPPLAAIETFLANILQYFKKRQSALHEDLYREGPPEPGWAIDRQKFYGYCSLVHEGDEARNYLATDKWVKSIASAYSAATTVLGIMEQIHAPRAQADGWLKGVVAALDTPNGDLDAFELVLKHINESSDPPFR